MSYIKLDFGKNYKRRALIDTDSCANAIPKSLLDDLENKQIKVEFENPDYTTVKLASGAPVRVIQQARIEFSLGDHHFNGSFLILLKMNNIILGNSFFRKHSIDRSASNNLIKMPNMTYHLNEIEPKNKTRKILKNLKKLSVFAYKKQVLKAKTQSIIECYIPDQNDLSLTNCSGVVIPNKKFEESTEIVLSSSLSTVDETGKFIFQPLTLRIIKSLFHTIQ